MHLHIVMLAMKCVFAWRMKMKLLELERNTINQHAILRIGCKTSLDSMAVVNDGDRRVNVGGLKWIDMRFQGVVDIYW
ncbi:hypothetical protein D3C75_1242510 [compost metagenome]